jgi:hypothetical protein
MRKNNGTHGCEIRVKKLDDRLWANGAAQLAEFADIGEIVTSLRSPPLGAAPVPGSRSAIFGKTAEGGLPWRSIRAATALKHLICDRHGRMLRNRDRSLRSSLSKTLARVIVDAYDPDAWPLTEAEHTWRSTSSKTELRCLLDDAKQS